MIIALTMADLRAGHPVGERLRADDSFAPADAGALGGRVKPGHGEFVFETVRKPNPKRLWLLTGLAHNAQNQKSGFSAVGT